MATKIGPYDGDPRFFIYLFFNYQYQNDYGQYNGGKIQYHEKVNQKPTNRGWARLDTILSNETILCPNVATLKMLMSKCGHQKWAVQWVKKWSLDFFYYLFPRISHE